MKRVHVFIVNVRILYSSVKEHSHHIVLKGHSRIRAQCERLFSANCTLFTDITIEFFSCVVIDCLCEIERGAAAAAAAAAVRLYQLRVGVTVSK